MKLSALKKTSTTSETSSKTINNMKKLDTIILIILTSIMTLCSTGLVYEYFVVMPFKRDAVEKGFATWQVINNSTGRTQFTWNSPLHEHSILDEIENMDLKKL